MINTANLSGEAGEAQPPGKIVIGVAGGTIAMVQAVQGRQLVATDSSSLGPTSVLASPLRSPLSCRQGDIC